MSKNHTGINREIDQVESRIAKTFTIKTETSTKFSQVKPRLDKLNWEIKRG